MKNLNCLCVIALMVACAGEPAIDTAADAELSFDGLSPVSNSRFANAWADPDIDITVYNKIIVGNAEFEFRAVKQNASTSSMRHSSDTEYWISDENKQKLVDEVSAVFAEEMKKSKNFTFVEDPGPDVLYLVGALHDIVSRVPPDRIGRSEVFLSSVGEATLVLEAHDSLSGETIYRAVERRNMERTGTGIRANSVTTWPEVRRLARRWATTLVEGLDAIHE